MPDAHPDILDRTTPVEHIVQHLAPQVLLLREVLDYGTNLLVRLLHFCPDKSSVNAIILGAMFKQALAFLDAVDILLSQGAIPAAQVPARSLHEAALYVTWVLERDTEYRVRCYYVSHLRHKRLWLERAVPGTAEYDKFVPHLDEFNLRQKLATKIDPKDAAQSIKAITAKLDSDTYRDINAQFDHVVRQRKREPHWYEPGGQRSIRQLANSLGLLAEYDIFYSILSNATHARAIDQHMSVKGGELQLQPIRHLTGIDTVLFLVLSTTFRLYRQLIGRFRPSELENFSSKYVRDWRNAFLGTRGVEYVLPQDRTT